jgi:energy-coupling factor transporter ATP-binding protein EcfA2
MGGDMYLSIENVRCFSSKQRVEVRPLTILVGENSSGKSTFLAMLHASMQGEFPTIPKIFNQAPFEMGGFDTIATYKGGKYGRAESFSVGIEWNRKSTSSSHSMSVKFEGSRGMPTVKELEVTMDDVSVKVNSVEDKVQLQILQKLPSGEKKISTKFPYHGLFSDDLQFFIRRSIFEIDRKDANEELIRKAQDAIRYGFQKKLSTYAMSPLRTEPKRTYDESSDLDFTPGGGHIRLTQRVWKKRRLVRLHQGEAPRRPPE